MRDIGDVRLALDGAFDQPVASPAGAMGAPRRSAAWIAAALLVTALVSGAIAWALHQPPVVQREVARFSVPLADDAALPDELRPLTGFALSPDGRTFV